MAKKRAARYNIPSFRRGNMKNLVWTGCYDESWASMLVPAAFGHPAKFSCALIRRIIEHCLEYKWLKKGDLVGDPFGGVACGGIIAASYGLRWIGLELEPAFVKLGNENIELHRRTWEQMGDPVPVLIQGDSRQFASIIGEQLGAVITSPPYAENLHGKKHGIDFSKAKEGGLRRSAGRDAVGTEYGQTPGQIGQLPTGELAGIVSSPPFEKTEPYQDKTFRLNDGRKALPQGQGGYGKSDGQIGRESQATYWDSMAQVYSECWKALRPGGVICLVVKSFVKAGKIVDLPSQTLALLEHLGFEPLERVRAMLTKTSCHASLFGGEIVKEKKRVSFFRRLYEKKHPEMAIDAEEVLVCRKPS